MNSLKPTQLLVFDALLLEQPFFELHPRHHQSRRHYFHPQNHAFHNENSSLICFFSSIQRHAKNNGFKGLNLNQDGTFPMLSTCTVRLLSIPSSSLNDIPMLGKTGLSNVNFGKDGFVLTDVLLVDFKQGYKGASGPQAGTKGRKLSVPKALTRPILVYQGLYESKLRV